jgi:hypothetical protein
LGHSIHAYSSSTEVRSFLPVGRLGSREGCLLLIIRRHTRVLTLAAVRIQLQGRPRVGAGREAHQARMARASHCPARRVSLTITPDEALGPTWFDGINGSGPGLSTETIAPTRQNPRAMPPTTSRGRGRQLTFASLQLPIPSFRDGLVCSSVPCPSFPLAQTSILLREPRVHSSASSETLHRRHHVNVAPSTPPSSEERRTC